MSASRRIAIVGGGWAGLSCAAWLRHHQPTWQIHLLEAAPSFGGRARGLFWQLPNSNQTIAIDNGQHLTIGAYRETFALLDMVGAPQWTSIALTWTGISANRLIAQQWQVPNMGWPWRVLFGLIPGQGPVGWPTQWKRSMSKTILGLARCRWQADAITAQTWLTNQNIPADLIAHFWRPFCEGALNTELEQASAQILVQVLRDSLAGPKNSTAVFTPSTNLSVDGVDPITHWLSEQDVSLAPRHLVESIQPHSDGQRLRLNTHPIRHDVSDDAAASPAEVFHDVVLALPPGPSIRLWDASNLSRTNARLRWERLSSRPITTVWIALQAAQLESLRHLPDWWVMNEVPGTPHVGQVVVKRQGAIGVVISAHGVSDKELAAVQLTQQLQVQLGLNIESCPQKWITEKHATWAATPDAPVASHDEANGLTGIAHLYRCADDLEPGYPATIESAVRSGKRTALRLAQSL